MWDEIQMKFGKNHIYIYTHTPEVPWYPQVGKAMVASCTILPVSEEHL